MLVVPAGAGKEHGPACLGCVTGDNLNTQQWAEELPGGHRGAARSESLASSPTNVCWLCNSCWKSKWQLEFPHFTALVVLQFSGHGEKKQNKRRAPKVHH